MSKIYERGCICPETPCAYHPTPNRPFTKSQEALSRQKESDKFWSAPKCAECGRPEASYRHNTESSPFAHIFKPRPQEALAAPLEPRWYSYPELLDAVTKLNFQNDEQIAKWLSDNLQAAFDKGFAKARTAQPPPAMTEPGDEVPWPLNLFCEMHADTTLADANVNDPCPLCAATAAEPHTLMREQIAKKAAEAYHAYQKNLNDKRSVGYFIADLALSLPSTRPIGEGWPSAAEIHNRFCGENGEICQACKLHPEPPAPPTEEKGPSGEGS